MVSQPSDRVPFYYVLFMPGTAGQRPTLPTGGRFAPTQGRALPFISEDCAQ